MPTNLYGKGDHYDPHGSHVLPALLRKFHEAKEAGHLPVTLWGSGAARREFLHVDDLADACCFALEHIPAGQVPTDLYNVGSGQEVTISELALLIQQIVGHRGAITWDSTQPDGTLRKLLDTSRIKALGWEARIPLADDLRRTYQDFLEDR